MGIVGSLLEHEIGDVGACDPIDPNKIPDGPPAAVAAARRCMGQAGRPNSDPIDIAFLNQLFLPKLVPKDERQNERNLPGFNEDRRSFVTLAKHKIT